ncbi:hypothetical protein GCM10009745_63100 [Kribbella yunnanensis]|uniref:Periplasmic binding protein domain-containing protein n=1 Tax=Kribbella yunnanensis TaxID=190194 RepID=A0ABP4UK28_9ACTN
MKRQLVGAAVALITSTALAACASTTKSSDSAGGSSAGPVQVAGSDEVDASTICGIKPTTVALADGFGGDTWRKTVLAELKDEAAKCKNVTEVRYANANGDQQKAISDINGFAAQGVDVIVVFPDFGAAMIPAMRSAMKSGATVIDYFVDLGGVAGQDYTNQVVQDSVGVGRNWADWYGTHLKNGNVTMLGGPPGAKSSQAFWTGFTEQLKKYPGIQLVTNDYVATSWSAVEAQKAVAGLIAKNPKIDGIASDYGVTASAAVKAFQAAGRPVPAIANIASNNEIDCAWNDLNAKGSGFPFYSAEKTTTLVRNAFRRGMADFQGIELKEPARVAIPVGIDTYDGKNPPCDKSAPPDADLFSGLTKAQLQEVFAQ